MRPICFDRIEVEPPAVGFDRLDDEAEEDDANGMWKLAVPTLFVVAVELAVRMLPLAERLVPVDLTEPDRDRVQPALIGACELICWSSFGSWLIDATCVDVVASAAA